MQVRLIYVRKDGDSSHRFYDRQRRRIQHCCELEFEGDVPVSSAGNILLGICLARQFSVCNVSCNHKVGKSNGRVEYLSASRNLYQEIPESALPHLRLRLRLSRPNNHE